MNNNGTDAYNQSLKSAKGHYKLEFTQMYEHLSERDIDLRYTYAKDLLSNNIGVPTHMINLKPKRTESLQPTLTARDEIFYVRVGNVIYGKMSIRTQRLRRNLVLIFIFQVKKISIKSPQKSFTRPMRLTKRTQSQRSQTNRKSYNARRGGRK
jgi:hypothetical protein